MNIKFLLPNKLKKIGWILIIISGILVLWSNVFGSINIFENVTILAIYNSGIPLLDSGYESGFFNIIKDDIDFEIITILFIVGGLFVSFSKLKNEDEFIMKIRLESLLWATYIHFIFLLVLTITVFGIAFFNVLLLNMFSILILFILRFHFVLFKAKKGLFHEE